MTDIESKNTVLPLHSPSSLSGYAANFQNGGKLNVGGKKKASKKSVKRSRSRSRSRSKSKSKKTKKCWWKLW